MKHVFALFTSLLLLLVSGVHAQQWTWLTGGNTPNVLPNYMDDPGGRQGSALWEGTDGKIYLFGGAGSASSFYSDIWAYDTLIHQWGFVSGLQQANNFGTYGEVGQADTLNNPGARYGYAHWVDSNGNFWLFGGYGYGASTEGSELNDLWKYSVETGLWTWVSGSSETNSIGVYGTQGIFDSTNNPGSRQHCAFWIHNDELYLYGGYGAGGGGQLSDMWKYSIELNQWVNLNGSDLFEVAAVYGVQNVPSSTNQPGARTFVGQWSDNNSGKLYLFGGYNMVQNPSEFFNDLWQYDIATNIWTWVSGNHDWLNGISGELGVPAANNIPTGRTDPVCFLHNNCLWLFGGNTNYYQTNDLWRYNISSGEWTWMGGEVVPGDLGAYLEQGPSTFPNYPSNKEAATGCVSDSGKFWLFGGTGSVGGVMNDLWKLEIGVEPELFNVTFQVDMAEVIGFNIPEVNGTFNQWCGNCSAMMDGDGDNIWAVTIAMPAGNYQYKYSTDFYTMQEALTPELPCTITEQAGFTNRQITINADTILPVVCWGTCSSCNPQPLNCPTIDPTLQNGLVGYWPFCGNANDESGNGNDGVVNGATLTEDRFGNVEGAYSFDGIDDAIEVSANADLLPNHITLSCWIKPFSGGHIIRSRFYGYIIYYDPNTNTVTFQLHHDTPEQSWTLNSYVNQGWNENEWHLVTGTFDGLENRLYVDGELVSTLPASTPNIIYSSDGLVVFGRDGNTGAGASHFNGGIDDIAIWNRALTQEEIALLFGDFGTPIAGCTDPLSCNFNADATINDPAQCCYENCLTLTMNDAFGNGWDGATATIMDAVGNFVGSASLNEGSSGTASFCLADGSYTIIVGGGTFDLEISWSLCGAIGGVIEGVANDPMGVGFSTGGDCVFGCIDPSACNYDALATTDNGSCTFAGDACDDGDAATTNDLLDADCACTGTLVNCAALEGTLQNGLVGYWPFCGNANDESGNGNDGVVNGATLTEDRFGVSGQAFYFNGQEDHIEILNSSSLSPTSLSISAWIKVPSSNIANEYTSLIAKWWQGLACENNSDSYLLYIDNSVNSIIGASQYNTSSPTFLSSDVNSIETDQWYHLTFIHDELDGQLLYLNGNLIAGNGISGALCPTTNNLFFGCDNNQGTLWRFFNGFLDDIAIWNRALTQEEIALLFGDFGTPIAGCTDPSACNFNADATIDDPTQCCFEHCVTLTMNDSGGDGWNGATATIMDAIGNVYAQATLFEGNSGTAAVCLPDGCYTLITGWGTNDSEISWTLTGITGGPISGGATYLLGTNFSTGGFICGPGCTNIFGCNYNPWASADDGSCIYPDCTDPNAINYNPEAGCDDGSCIIPTPDPSAQVLSYAGPLDILHCTEGHIGGVYIQNTGVPTLNGFITIECDGMFTPIPTNSFITPMASSAPGSGIWQFLNYTTGMENVFSYFVEGPGVDFIGNSYPFTMSVMIYDESGNIVVDQTWTQNLEVTCAYDPNDLTPRPLGYTDNHFIEAGDTVLFRVRFQNLGNAAATNVHIDIPLDSTVWDFNSFEQAFPLALEVGCLHDPGDLDYATGILEYELNNIQLPDSASDPVGSMRSFHFRLRARTDLPAGTVLLNQALIYFDENPPIYTNQTYHTIFDCTSFTPMVGDDTYCLGDTILLQATQPYVDSYNWSVDGFSASGDTLRYAPLVAGTYDIALQTTNALCVNGEWHNTTVNVFALPELDVPLNASPCVGETITFAAASNAPVSWSNGANTGDTIEATESFTVTATAVGEGDCAVSEDWSVTVNTPPSTTVIADGNTLTATDGIAWQWYLNGLPLAGETGMSIETTPNENYTVVITGANGCAVDTTVTEVHQALAQVVRIYPNPMREHTRIVLPEGTFDMVLHDMMGRSVWQRSSQRGMVILERGTLASGVYQLRMSNAETHLTTPLILE